MYLADMILLCTNAEAAERAAVHDPRLLHAEVPREQDLRRDAGIIIIIIILLLLLLSLL